MGWYCNMAQRRAPKGLNPLWKRHVDQQKSFGHLVPGFGLSAPRLGCCQLLLLGGTLPHMLGGLGCGIDTKQHQGGAGSSPFEETH